MHWFDRPRAIVPRAFVAVWLVTAGNGCDSGPASIEVPRGTLELNPPTTTIAPGEVLVIPFLFSDGSDAPVPSPRLEWTSSDPGVALVDPHGAVTARAPGTTWIRARHDVSRDSLLLTVRPLRFRQVVAGDGWSCGLTPDGALYCWGRVMTGRVPDRSFPLRIAPELLLDRIALEEIDLCGFGTSGELYCARDNPQRTLQRVPGGPYQQVSSSGATTCGIDLAGSAFCGRWDFVAPGPIDVPPLNAIDIGDSFFQCGTTADGEAWCWGFNKFGELGNGTRVDSAVPVRAGFDLRFRQVEAGSSFTCGITVDDEMWCWGLVLYGAKEDSVALSPYRVSLPHPVTKIESGGFRRICALASGEVWCMGTRLMNPPQRIEGLPPLVDLSVGSSHGCGTTADQQAWCFGANFFGQLGNGTLDKATIGPPTRVADRAGRTP